MKKLSLSKRIENYLKRNGGWVNGGELERLAMSVGYKASNASRRCREMASGISSNGNPCPIVLEKKEENGSVWYRYITQYQKKEVPVLVDDENGRRVIIQEKLIEV